MITELEQTNELGEEGLLSDDEHKLIGLLRLSKDPSSAIETAIKVILDFLAQPQSFGKSLPAALQEPDGITE